MIFRELNEKDAGALKHIIIDMYAHSYDIEGFVPIPYDELNMLSMLTDSRYYFFGAFIGNVLVGVACLDYLCSDLLDKLKQEQRFKLEKIVELYFVVVHSEHRKQGIMKELYRQIIEKVQKEKYSVIFGKANKFNFATISSFLHSQFERYMDYEQKINKQDFEFVANSEFLMPHTKFSAENTLKRFKDKKYITLKYSILVKQL